MATQPEDQSIENTEELSQAAAIPLFCPRDGSILEDGERHGYSAWVCPTCTYWKIKL